MCVYGCVNMSVGSLRSQSVVSLEAGHKGCHVSPDVGVEAEFRSSARAGCALNF